MQDCRGQFRRVKPEVTDRLGDGHALAIRACKQIGIQFSHKRETAEERFAESHALLLGETDYFDGEGKRLSGAFFHKGDTQDHSKYAVEGAGVGDCVQMEPTNRRGAFGWVPASVPRRLPAASMRGLRPRPPSSR